jgi:hypothetical protein
MDGKKNLEELMAGFQGGGIEFVTVPRSYVRSILDAFKELEAENERLRNAVRDSWIALDDWLHTYAPECCRDEDVVHSRARIAEGGTLYYIATVQERNRAALGSDRHEG